MSWLTGVCRGVGMVTKVVNRSWSWSGSEKRSMTGARESDSHVMKSERVCQSRDKRMTNKGRL